MSPCGSALALTYHCAMATGVGSAALFEASQAEPTSSDTKSDGSPFESGGGIRPELQLPSTHATNVSGKPTTAGSVSSMDSETAGAQRTNVGVHGWSHPASGPAATIVTSTASL